MGVTIHMEVHSLSDLLPSMEKFVEDNGGYREGAFPVRQFFIAIAHKFGIVADGKYYVMHNEYFEDYNPASNFARAVETYYFPLISEAYFETDDYNIFESGVLYSEVLEEAFPEEFGEDAPFEL